MVLSVKYLLEKTILIGSESLELYQRLQFLIFQKQRRRGSCNIFRLQQQGTLCELSRELKNNSKGRVTRFQNMVPVAKSAGKTIFGG